MNHPPRPCPYCQEPYTPHCVTQGVCSKPECKKAAKAAYMKTWHANAATKKGHLSENKTQSPNNGRDHDAQTQNKRVGSGKNGLAADAPTQSARAARNNEPLAVPACSNTQSRPQSIPAAPVSIPAADTSFAAQPLQDHDGPDARHVSAHSQRRNIPPLSAIERLPWATADVCTAVAQGIAHPTAQKLGVFAVVRPMPARPPLVHVPSNKLDWPSSCIIVVARLNPRGKWAQRPFPASLENVK